VNPLAALVQQLVDQSHGANALLTVLEDRLNVWGMQGRRLQIQQTGDYLEIIFDPMV